MRILAIDDDEGRIKLMEQMLTPHGYIVERFMPNQVMREDFPFGDYCAITLDNDMCLRETNGGITVCWAKLDGDLPCRVYRLILLIDS